MTLASTMPAELPLRLREKPSKGLVATQDIAVGDFFLVPCTRNISDNDAKSTHAVCTVQAPDGTSTKYSLGSMPATEKLTVSFFHVQTTDKKESANVGIQEYEVRSIVPTHLDKLKISGHEYVAKIPCIVPLKKIDKDDDLRIYKKSVKVATQLKDLEVNPLGAPPAAKRKKIS